MQQRNLLLILVLVLVLVVAAGAVVYRRSTDQEIADDQLGLYLPPVTVVVAAPPPTETPMPTPDQAAIARQLKSDQATARLAAATLLAHRSDIPAAQRADLLLDTLEREIAAPTNEDTPEGIAPPFSDYLKLTYTRLLGELGSDAQPALRQATAKTGEMREWASLALGITGARDAVPQLRAALHASQNNRVREVSAYLLGTLGAKEAIPDLEQALNDKYSFTTQYHDKTIEIYPVREQAAGSLVTLGVKVERQDDGGYRVGGT